MLDVKRSTTSVNPVRMAVGDIIYKEVDETYDPREGSSELDHLREKVQQLTRIVAALVQELGNDVAKPAIKKSCRRWTVRD